ncbi:S41 family peptidase [Parafilimonas sp.]|uniref:S41 family peptidase n=1 Tax=Parafilimonas sp. TaxID=1969739 RepID=UPI0039E49D38
MTKIFCLAFIFLMLSSSVVSAQKNCNCESDFLWTKQTFEQNDAGFQYVIDQKGKASYEAHNAAILAKVKQAKTTTECTPILYEWLSFFRKGHIGINLLNNSNQQQAPTMADSNVVARHETLPIDETAFKQKIEALNSPTPEGIWVSEPYTVGIVKTDSGYSGFIIDAPGTQWKKGQVKLKLYPAADSSYTANFWMRDFSENPNHNVEIIGNNLINVGDILYLKRQSKNFDDPQSIKDYVQYLYTGTPYFKQLSEKTAYIRIPSFDISQKRAIDSVIEANKTAISSTLNLIIDVRNNGGGADASFGKLMPYLYTNPVRTVWAELLSTKLNNEAMLQYSKDGRFSENDREEFKKAYDTLSKNLGKFVRLSDKPVAIETMDTIYPKPANVAIIINENNASTTEEFLLAAKQSKKVKLFGTTTFGSLDISNMYNVKSPCNDFELWYCRSKSLRIPDMTIDSKGIQPDYYIDKTIPGHQWVDFVRGVLDDK